MHSGDDTKTGSLKEALTHFSGQQVVILGDIMLDRYLFGNVDRISPEAPVPVVNLTDERLTLGGAGNVAKNIRALGGLPILFGLSGQDGEGDRLRDLLQEEGIEAHLVEDPERPTIIKTRVIAHNQQVVRLDKESTAPASPGVIDSILQRLEPVLRKASVLIISDYAKGLINVHLMDGLRELLAGQPHQPRLLVDPKPKNIALYRNVFLLTPNAKEAAQCAGMSTLTHQADIIRSGRTILDSLSCENVLITLGARGMVLFEQNSPPIHIPTVAQNVYDVTGAGDTVIATLGLALAAGQSLPRASLLANYAAGYVVGELGSATATTQDLERAILQLPTPEISQWAA